MAKDVAALKRLRASISVSTADASEPSQVRPHLSDASEASQVRPHLSDARADACVLSLREDSGRLFLVAGGGIGVWRREQQRRGRGGGDGSGGVHPKAGGGKGAGGGDGDEGGDGKA